MLRRIDLVVPGTPAPQGNHRVSRAGRIYDKRRDLVPWRDSIAWHARRAIGTAHKLLRAVLDALTGTAYLDDSQVVEVAVSVAWHAQPGAEIRVEEI